MIIVDMDSFEVIQAILDCKGNKFDVGRTAIQKLAYLSKEANSDIDLTDFVPHYFGPYSSILASSLTKLVEYFFVDESRTRKFNFTSYKYELTSNSKVNIDKQAESYMTIKKIVDICKEYCDLNAKSLSFAAKVFHMKNMSNTNQISIEDMIEKAKKLNWDITNYEIKSGEKLLDKLELCNNEK